MKRGLINTEKYITRIREGMMQPISEVDTMETLQKLNQPFSQIDYKEKDALAIDNGEVKLDLAYSSLQTETNVALKQYIDRLKTQQDDAPLPYHEIKNWRKIDKLILNVLDHEIDFFQHLPPDYEIYFSTNQEYVNGRVNITQRKIFIVGRIDCFSSLLTLSHELGHAWDDDEQLRAETPDLFSSSHNHLDQAEKIREERVATAFVMKLWKPIFRTKPSLKKDAEIFLKSDLNSYYQAAKEMMASTR